jgi:4-carboxymuconolactone decarboxylase
MRLPRLTNLTDDQTELSTRLPALRAGTGGPFGIWLRSPELCERVEALAAYCIAESALPLRLRELTLLIVARHFDAPHPWLAHADKAVAAGIDPQALRSLAAGEDPEFTDADERLVYQFSTELLRGHFVADGTFAAVLDRLGERGLVDLVGAIGNFAMFAMLLNAVQADLPPDREPPFPDLRGYGR